MLISPSSSESKGFSFHNICFQSLPKPRSKTGVRELAFVAGFSNESCCPASEAIDTYQSQDKIGSFAVLEGECSMQKTCTLNINPSYFITQLWNQSYWICLVWHRRNMETNTPIAQFFCKSSRTNSHACWYPETSEELVFSWFLCSLSAL